MSSFLYDLGRGAFRHRGRVLLGWLLALLVLGGTAALISKPFEEQLSVPGTESQAALDQLGRTFPQLASTSAEIIVVAPEGDRVTDLTVRQAVEDRVRDVAALPGVDSVTTPYDELVDGLVSDDGRAGIIRIQLEGSAQSITDEQRQQLVDQARELAVDLPGSTVSAGGEAYNTNIPGLSPVEGIGVVIALIVLLITLGSFRAAGMPLLTAILGVGVSMTLIIGVTSVVTVSSTTPLLALMLGLAVGIDYALFIVSRHREQLGQGLDPEESTGRAIATAGSAVVFAGITVIIALVGLSVAGIPFLGVMGMAAAVSVAIAVAIALTLIPALLGFAGAKLTPKPKRARRAGAPTGSTDAATSASTGSTGRSAHGGHGAQAEEPVRGWAGRWVRTATKVPILTVVVVIVALGALALPTRDLELALPNAGEAEIGTPARTTYDLVDEYFGPGYNGPLIVTGEIVTSTDPLGLMDDLKREIEQVPGVETVPLATPNQNADTGIVQVVPTTGPQDPATAELVQRLRDRAPEWQEEYGVDLKVTGYTAVAIDISDRLGQALLPFGVFVVGLSLVLLTIVFRSVLVPLKATVGFLLSVGAAFGLTTLVFNQGVGASLIHLESARPVISFMPIIVMGVLFGLAMDYEVFLVSRIREHFVHGESPRRAIHTGFVSSAPVVVAAAVIMFAVFAFFVPEGDGPIKAIAFGLAVGVFVDAFVVRMTLVPAVLALLGKWAWWLPRWLDRRLPHFDVEGDAIRRRYALADWPYPGADKIIYTERLTVDGLPAPLAVDLDPGTVLVATGPADRRRTALLGLTGRLSSEGDAWVCGRMLTDEPGRVRRRSAWLDDAALRRGPGVRTAELPVLVIDDADRLSGPAVAALAGIARERAARGAGAVILGAEHVEAVREVADALPGPFQTLDLHDQHPTTVLVARTEKEYTDVSV